MGQAFSNLFNRKNDSTPNNNQTPENNTQNSAEETKHQNLHAEVNEPQQPLYSGPGAELERNRTVYVNRRNGAQDAVFLPNNLSGVNRINTYNRTRTVSEGSSVRLRPIPERNNNVNAQNNQRNQRNRPAGHGHARTRTITSAADITGTPVQNQTTPNTQNHYTPIDANTRQNNRTPSIQRDNTQQGNTQQHNNTRRSGNTM
ncbi:MAG: hypothetical protein IJS76_09015 [Pseudobutyrivibrio sp.]|nr:hypothetical protein [Pseudobutyrivibrio sp.]